MKTLKLKSVPITPDVLSFLEKRKLVMTLRPTFDVLDPNITGSRADKIYSSSPEFGGHSLICVSLDHTTQIKLTSHPDNEEFIIVNNTRHSFKPLYLVVGLHKHEELEDRARNGKLSEKDVMVLKLRYNDPKTCIFTMLKDTPHYEITTLGRGISPVFFVSEPSNFKMNYLNLHDYTLIC